MDLTVITEALTKVFEFLGLNFDIAGLIDQIVAWFQSIIGMIG